MHIKIINAEMNKEGENIVNFFSLYGTAKAIWRGSSPIADKAYEVEIDTEDTFSLEKNIHRSATEKYSIKTTNLWTEINGKIELISQEDGIAAIRLGETVFLIDCKGNIGEKESFITLKTKKIYISDINL